MRTALLLAALACSACAAQPATPYAANTDGAPDCRDFTGQAMIGDEPQQVTGRACRQPDGTWRIGDAATANGQVVTLSAAPYPYTYAYDPWYWGWPWGFGSAAFFIDRDGGRGFHHHFHDHGMHHMGGMGGMAGGHHH